MTDRDRKRGSAGLIAFLVLLFLAVTPATWLIDDASLRRAVTRIVTRRFAMLTGIALVLLLLTGIYQFTSETLTPPDVQDNISRMWFGPRIGRATDEVVASNDDPNAVWRLESLRRTSLIFSFVMLIVTVAIFAIGITLGNHAYSQILRG